MTECDQEAARVIRQFAYKKLRFDSDIGDDHVWCSDSNASLNGYDLIEYLKKHGLEIKKRC